MGLNKEIAEQSKHIRPNRDIELERESKMRLNQSEGKWQQVERKETG